MQQTTGVSVQPKPCAQQPYSSLTTSCALQLQTMKTTTTADDQDDQRAPARPAYVQTMKLYESEHGVETLPCLWLRLYKVRRARRQCHKISHSQEPLFSKEETQAVIDEAEERALRMGGWTTKRHANYATTDVPVQELPEDT